MRIAFDMVVAERECGAAWYATQSLLLQLSASRDDLELLIITSRPRLYLFCREYSNVSVYRLPLHERRGGVLTQHQVEMLKLLKRIKPDILHIPSQIAPIGWPGPIVMVLYELHQPEAMYAMGQDGLLWEHLQQESLHQARYVLCLSLWIYERLSVPTNTPLERIQHVTVESQVLALQEVYSSSRPVAIAEGSEYPDVSVIIPTTRPEMVKHTLQTLNTQQYAGSYEIIVVGQEVARLAHYPYVRVLVTEERVTPGRARNLGAAVAQSEVLLFLDDDMLVTPLWLKKNVQALREVGVGIVGARMPGVARTFFARCVDYVNYGHYQHGLAMDTPVGAGSMSIWRESFRQLDGFDEELRSGEDIDLCFRLQKLGYRAVYRPSIVVQHNHQYMTLQRLVAYNYQHGLRGGLITKKRHMQGSKSNWLLSHMQHPFLFIWFIPWIALVAMFRIVQLNVVGNPGVIVYAPFIWLGKVAYNYGIFIHLRRRGETA